MIKFKISNFILAFMLVLMSVGCDDFLTEVSVTDITANSYIINEAGYEDLVKAGYPTLRDIILQYRLVLPGTDIFQAGEWSEIAVGDGPVYDTYNVGFNSFLGDLQSFWTLLYKQIGRTNTAIGRADAIKYADNAKKEVRVSEAKFLRALGYFYLVQTWGDVPMPLTEVVTPDRDLVRVPYNTPQNQDQRLS